MKRILVLAALHGLLHSSIPSAPVRSLRLLVLVMAAPAAALEEELAAMEAADAADLQLHLLPKQLILPELLLPKQPTLLQQPLLW